MLPPNKDNQPQNDFVYYFFANFVIMIMNFFNILNYDNLWQLGNQNNSGNDSENSTPSSLSELENEDSVSSDKDENENSENDGSEGEHSDIRGRTNSVADEVVETPRPNTPIRESENSENDGSEEEHSGIRGRTNSVADEVVETPRPNTPIPYNEQVTAGQIFSAIPFADTTLNEGENNHTPAAIRELLGDDENLPTPQAIESSSAEITLFSDENKENQPIGQNQPSNDDTL